MPKHLDGLRRALVVDDEPEIKNQIEEALAARGWIVEGCGDGTAALAAVDRLNPSVVVLDLKMPKKDGIAVLHELRERRPWTQVVILTGHGTEDDTVECLNQHAFRFLRKPVVPSRVADACEEALNQIPSIIFAFLKWFDGLPDQNRVVFQTASGKQVSAIELRDQIQRQTPVGQEFIRQVMGVAVEMVSERL